MDRIPTLSVFRNFLVVTSIALLVGCTSQKAISSTPSATQPITGQIGTFAIPPQFAQAESFHEGLAAVLIGGEKDGKWGYIDKTGKVLIPPQFNTDRTDTLYSNYKYYKEVASQPHPFSEGLAAVKVGSGKEGKWGYIDKTGKMVIAPQFNEPSNFSEGLALFYNDDYKFGYIDKNGKVVIPAQFELAGDFNEGRAAVQLAGKKSYALIDKSGKVIAQYGLIGPFENGLAPVSITDDKNSATGFIDRDGKLVITLPAEVGSVRYHRFNEGLAPFVTRDKEKRYGFIDQTGKVVIPAQFITLSDTARGFQEGLAGVQVSGHDEKSSRWGFIDKTGKLVIPAEFSYVGNFKRGLAPVIVNGDWSKFGYIDKSGKLVIPAKFDTKGDQPGVVVIPHAGDDDEGVEPVQVEGKFGYIYR